MDSLAAEQLLSFSWFDYTLFAMMLLFSLLIGIYFGCFGSKQNTTSEYLLGSRNMKVFPVAVSLVAGHLSGITLLGIPAEIYMYGGQYYVSMLTAILTTIGVVYIYLPTFYNLELKSSYEYLKIRFDERVRTIALVLYVISSFLYIPIVIFVPALAFNQVSGFNIHTVTPVLCSVCIFYTTIGGLKAVVWTDTLQFIITLAAIFAVLVLGIMKAGGIGNVLAIAEQGERLDFFHLDLDPTIRTTFWGVAIGMTFSWLGVLGVAPSCVQRFMSVPTLRKSKMTAIYFGIGMLLSKFLVCFCGYIMYAKYYNCDPFSNKKIKHPDQILIYYVIDVARNIPGLPGIFISGVFSTALSTMSAHLNTLAGVIYEDFIRKFLPEKTTEETANRIIKSTVVVAGIICVILVFVIERLGGIIQISGCLSGITAGPLLGLFTIGMLFPQVTTKATLYAAVIAISFMTWLGVGFQYHFINKNIRYSYKPLSVENCTRLNETLTSTTSFLLPTESSTSFLNKSVPHDEPFFLFRLSFYWYPIVGFSLVMVIGLLLTYLFKEENEPSKRYNKSLYSPVIHRFIKDTPADYKSVECALTSLEKNTENY